MSTHPNKQEPIPYHCSFVVHSHVEPGTGIINQHCWEDARIASLKAPALRLCLRHAQLETSIDILREQLEGLVTTQTTNYVSVSKHALKVVLEYFNTCK